MTERSLLSTLTLLVALSCTAALAQVPAATQRTPGGLSLPEGTGSGNSNRTADFIVALVNSEPVTNHDVRVRLRQVEQNIAQRGIAGAPPRDELARQVLEQLINERAQIQHASQSGLRVNDQEIDQAEQNIAAQNQMSQDEFRRRLAAEGIDVSRFRSELRQQLLLQRVREREVNSTVRVTDADIDDYIREQQGGSDLANLELNLSHVLVSVPENASAALVAERQARAQRVAERARAGEDFATLAREFSDAPERVNGGQFGWRAATRLPDVFVSQTRALAPGEIAGPFRSLAGFHVLKVNDRRGGGLPAMNVTQTRVSHILLRPGPQLTEQDAQARLAQYRQQIVGGQATFENLAREHSQDGSAAGGGNLGWSVPGMFVPEFEQAMAKLQPGEISEPVVSRFGVHLIRVDERRTVPLNERDQRERIRGLVREEKAQEALALWARDIRARAFVEIREAPQP
ncbi:MAG: peptidylprolyl isomerase [Hydrogenophaga sp.]|uniref:peptidylprolyl isomerase n=1 Tax=Hydrogenophaga sp. TaxID=1904254 RepID=UPI001D94F6CA|nr:peptidylprolyl isomerase [Hydrogenophaga sp.]MBX3611887.1 peptidylprolyl isomerase [Hydrogenophaga sp.]